MRKREIRREKVKGQGYSMTKYAKMSLSESEHILTIVV